MSYTINIPKPCHEDWYKMTPTEKGAFCSSCAKEVQDFTNIPTSKLLQHLKEQQNSCGRFTKRQIQEPLKTSSQSQWKNRMLALGFSSVMATVSVANGQTVVSDAIEVQSTLKDVTVNQNPEALADTNITVNGIVKVLEQPAAGVKIQLEGTTMNTISDRDGSFCLEIPVTYLEENNTLRFDYLGFTSIIIPVYKTTKDLDVAFTAEDEVILGGLVIVERRNIFKKIGSWFKKKN